MDYRAQDLQAGIAYQFNPLWLSTFVFTSKAAEGVPSKSGKDFLKKDDSLAPGQILCTLCNTGINYGARGVAAIKAHVNSKKHGSLLNASVTNAPLPIAYRLPTQPIQPVNREADADQPTASTIKSVKDRVINLEAMVIATLAKHDLPFTFAPVLVDLCKEMARDVKALSGLSIGRNSASYKLVHGLAPAFTNIVIDEMRNKPFSLNIDESMSSAKHEKVRLHSDLLLLYML